MLKVINFLWRKHRMFLIVEIWNISDRLKGFLIPVIATDKSYDTGNDWSPHRPRRLVFGPVIFWLISALNFLLIVLPRFKKRIRTIFFFFLRQPKIHFYHIRICSLFIFGRINFIGNVLESRGIFIHRSFTFSLFYSGDRESLTSVRRRDLMIMAGR